MLLSKAKAENVYRKVKHIREQMSAYCLAPDKIPVSIDDLHWVVQDMYDLQIVMRDVSFEANFIRGLVERYDNNTARILVRADQSVQYKRYVTAKELCHLAIDEWEDWSPQGTLTIQKLLDERKQVDDNGGRMADVEVQSEQFAEIAALEILYPHLLRKADSAAINAGQTTTRTLALEYMIPEHVVAEALRGWFMDTADKLWATVGLPGT